MAGVISYAKRLIMILLVTAAVLLGVGTLATSRPILGRDKYISYCDINSSRTDCVGGTGRPGQPYRRPGHPYIPYLNPRNNTYGGGGERRPGHPYIPYLNPKNNTYGGRGERRPGCESVYYCRHDHP